MLATLSLVVQAAACGGAAPAAPSGSPTAATSSGAVAGSSPTSAPTSVATRAPAATVVPSARPIVPDAATTASSQTAANPALNDLAAKVKALGDYSYDYSVDLSGMSMSGKAYVKGAKMRQETTFSGTKMVTIIDSATKVAYELMPDQKTAIKADFGTLKGASSPTDEVNGMPSSAQAIGTDTVYGEPVTIYQYEQGDTSAKLWIWTEKGVPLKVDVTASGQHVTMTFSNYQFGSLDASLFEVPSDYTLMQAPSSTPGSSSAPTPKAAQ